MGIKPYHMQNNFHNVVWEHPIFLAKCALKYESFVDLFTRVRRVVHLQNAKYFLGRKDENDDRPLWKISEGGDIFVSSQGRIAFL